MNTKQKSRYYEKINKKRIYLKQKYN
jgi:hypothetical protein